MIIVSLVALLLAIFFVGFFTGETCGYSADALKLQRKFEQEWFSKYLEKTYECGRLYDELASLYQKSAETLKDNIELERYLRDEERDVSDESIDYWFAVYCELSAEIRTHGATLKDIRRRLDKGELGDSTHKILFQVSGPTDREIVMPTVSTLLLHEGRAS